MHAKFVQISAAVTAGGATVLYALDENGDVWEKIVTMQGRAWTKLEG